MGAMLPNWGKQPLIPCSCCASTGMFALSESTAGLGVVNGQASSTDESSVGRHLQEQLSRCGVKLAQCEQVLPEENNLLMANQ